MTNLIGLGYKQRVGKDLTAKIIQYLTSDPKVGFLEWEKFPHVRMCEWQNKKFADTLKDIVCLLTGCTKEQLEDAKFKEKELGEEWWYYKGEVGIYPYDTPYEANKKLPLIKPTFRMLLQQIGTDLFRNKLHPQIWVNALMGKYMIPEYYSNNELRRHVPQKWIISDVRFNNEAKAIKDRGGILIKINRNTGIQSTHLSETELDSYTDWNYEIDNNGSITDLINQVKQILLKEKIIN